MIKKRDSFLKFSREKKYACLASPRPEAPSESAEGPVLGPVEGLFEARAEGARYSLPEGPVQGLLLAPLQALRSRPF